MLNYPLSIKTAKDRYRYAYAALEAVRLKHNTRAGDLSPEANGFRRKCLGVQRLIIADILKMRPQIADPNWTPDPNGFAVAEPEHVRLKALGKSEHANVDLPALTGVDIDAQGIS